MVTKTGNDVTQELPRLYSQIEVGKILELDNATISRLCTYGVIDTVRDDKSNKFLGITEEELDRLKAMPRGMGKGYLPLGRKV